MNEEKTVAVVGPLEKIRSMLRASKDRLGRALVSKGIDPDEFIVGVMTQINATPKLLTCTSESVLLGAFRAAMLGLRIDGVSGHAYLIPRRRKNPQGGWQMEAQFQVGYQGILEHIYRSKDVKSVYAAAVRQEDEWSPPRYTEEGVSFAHAPNFEVEDRGPFIAAYAKVRLVRDDEPLVFAYPIEQIYRDHRAMSQAYEPDDPDCPWVKYEEAMIVKTMYIIAGKYIPKSVHTSAVVNIADRLDKGLEVFIDGADNLDAKSSAVVLTPESLSEPDSVEGQNDSKGKPDPAQPGVGGDGKATKVPLPTSVNQLKL